MQAFDVVSQDPPDTDPTALYLYGPGGLDDLVGMMLECDETPGLNQAAETFFAHTDAQDSVVALVRPNGTVAERYAYAPFGAPSFYDGDGYEIGASAVNNTRLYTGRPWNADLGLYDFRNRQYDPALGRLHPPPTPTGAYGDWNNLGNAYRLRRQQPRRVHRSARTAKRFACIR